MADDAARTTTNDVRLHDVGWRPLLRVLVGVGLLVLAMAVVRQLADLLEMLLVAVFLAIAADAVTRALQRAGVPRRLALVTVIAGAVVSSVLIVLVLLPPVVRQGASLVVAAPDIAREVEASEAWQQVSDQLGLGDHVIDAAKDLLVQIPKVVLGLIDDLVGGVFGAVTLVIAVSFLLVGGGQALGLLVRLVPALSTARGWSVVVGAYTNIGRYIVGATAQAVCAGASLAAVLIVLDVPYALSLGVFMLIMDYIPLVGATIGSIPAVAVALFTGGWNTGLLVLAFLVVYQQVENSLIQPRIQGRVVKLPGIAIFFSVMVGGQLLGILGALIAVPVASIAAIVMNQYFEHAGRPRVVLPPLFDERGHPIPARAPVVDAPDPPQPASPA